MNDDHTTEDTDNVSQGDSPVISELRKENRQLVKKLAEFEKAQEEAEAAAQTRRQEAALEAVNTLNLPGLAEDVLAWVDGDVTADSVREAIEARGIPIPSEAQPQTQGTSAEVPVSASNVGQQVADAARGVDRTTLEDRIAQATSDEELTEIMREAGLVQTHT